MRFDSLPHDTELVLALRRDDEVYRASQSLFLPFGAVVRADVRVPPPPAEVAEPDDPLPVVDVTVETQAFGDSLAEGATWR